MPFTVTDCTVDHNFDHDYLLGSGGTEQRKKVEALYSVRSWICPF